MTENVESKVSPGRESAGLFDAACNRVCEMTQARPCWITANSGAKSVRCSQTSLRFNLAKYSCG